MRRTVILKRAMAARQILPRDVYFWLKAVLLALVAVQGARLVWTIVTPLGPIGRWLPAAPATIPEAAQLALFSTFDPFSAASSQAAPGTPPAAASGFTLFGTRMSLGGAPGSAIIAGADGVQDSYTVGDEIAPGVRLLTVGFDFVLLKASGGGEQRLVMEGADAESAPAAPATGSVAGAGGRLTPQALRDNVALAPRMVGGRVTGFLVSAVGDPAFLARTGLRDGDVITAVNGRPLTSAAALQSQLAPGARLSLSVERGAATVPVALLLEGT